MTRALAEVFVTLRRLGAPSGQIWVRRLGPLADHLVQMGHPRL